MEDRVITFKDWKTGRKVKYNLHSAYPCENKTDLICPFDESPIIWWYNEQDKGHHCPNCNLNYPTEIKNQEEVDKFFQDYLSDLKIHLIRLDSQKKNIEYILTKGELALKNKANLSAQNNIESSKGVINIEKYSKLEEEFGGNAD